MPRIGTEMPSLEGATEWFNATGARAAAEAQGRPTLVHFWSAGCSVCKDNLPHVAAWRERFDGLHIIAVHSPHSEVEADAEQVRDEVSLNQITEPCAMDNEGKLRAAFQNESDEVPAYYLYDDAGKLHSFAAGEGGLQEVGAALEDMFAARQSGESAP
ncbi:MAG TPA: redoxin domain-containing protein [Pyrinomonadaceae bacterium]